MNWSRGSEVIVKNQNDARKNKKYLKFSIIPIELKMEALEGNCHVFRIDQNHRDQPVPG